MDILKLQEICNRYKGCADEYYVDKSIPQHKAQNARESLNVPSSETIIALIDFTVFGGAKDAMVVTEKGLYWKGLAEDAKKISWSHLKHRNIQEEKTLGTRNIKFSPNLKMSLTGATELQKNDNHAVLNLLKDIQKIHETELSNDKSGAKIDSRDDGLIEYEYCKSKIKPDVTYCKECGIKLR